MIDDRVRVQLAVYGACASAALVGVVSMALGLERIWPGMAIGAAITFTSSVLGTGNGRRR